MGTSYKIKVTFGVDIPGLTPAVSDTQETVVDVKHECQVTIPSNGKVFPVRLMPHGVCQPTFLMVRPMKVGNVEVKKTEDLKDLKLEYATILGKPEDKDRDRKPITGTHVFANGMAEWVTDMTAKGKPGPLKSLYFWNTTPPVWEVEMKDGKPVLDEDGNPKLAMKDGNPIPAKEKDGKPSQPRSVTVLIFVGYSPIPKDDTTDTEPEKKEGTAEA
jgi:hypothetical protein